MSAHADYTQTHSPCFPEDQGEWIWVPKNTMPGFPATTHQSPMYRSPSGSSHASGPAMPYTPSLSPTYSPVARDFPSVSDGSPVEPLLEGFDFDMSMYLNTYLGDANPSEPWAFPAPDAASMDLFPNGLDADFSGLDFGLGFEGVDSFAPVPLPTANSLNSLTYSNMAAAPLAPLTPATPATATTSPSSATSPPTLPPKPTQLLPCPEPTCPKTFPTKSDLRYVPPSTPNSLGGTTPHHHQNPPTNTPPHSRHERKHRAPVRCPLPACGKGHLDNRALARHLWAKHPEYAQQSGARSERVRCAFCEYEGRQDNVARHMKRHAK